MAQFLTELLLLKLPPSSLFFNVHFLFFYLSLENSPCASIETDDRITCGWSGITEDDCKKLGCCYKDLTCFKPDGQSTNCKYQSICFTQCLL